MAGNVKFVSSVNDLPVLLSMQFVFDINEKQKRPNIEPSGTPHKTREFLTDDTPFTIQNCCLFSR